MTEEIIKNLGPLAGLAGTWEGDKGFDVAIGDDRKTEHNKFRERMVFEPLGPVNNHEQLLYGLRYSTTAWRIGEPDAFHEELGYWLWDAKDQHVVRCFMVPRGVTVIAGGIVKPDAKTFTLCADSGSDTWGICSNKFLAGEFKVVHYEVKITVHDAKSFSYEEDSVIKIKGQTELFHHTDKNTVRRV